MHHPRRILSLLLLGWLPLSAAGPEQRLAELGYSLPTPAPAVANYVPAVRSGSLIYLAGHLPRDERGDVITGQVGVDCTEEQAIAAARHAAVALLATLKAELGSLERVRRIVRVTGFVNAPAGYTRHPTVLNGCSDLLVDVFGEAGRHARSAVGAASLPLNAVVEVELIVEVAPETD